MEKKLVYDVHERPVFSKMIIFALQQLLAILAATLAALFGAGVGTLVYQLFTKFKSPVFLGSSFAFLGPLFTAVAYGYCGIILGSVVAGLAYVLIAVIIHFVGTDWVNKLMPPVIIGPTVALIGLSLAGSAMGDLVKASGVKETFFNPETLETEFLYASYNLAALFCGIVTFLTVIICSTQKKYTMPKLIPFIIGIGAGYVTAAILTFIGDACNIDYLRIIDFTPLVNNFVTENGEFTGIKAFFNLPDFALVEAIKELASGTANLDGGSVLEVIVAFLPVALVVFAEHIADHKNLSSIIGKDLIKDPGLEKTLLGDGVGSIAGTIFGVCPNTTYGESVGCVAITKNASVATITTTAFMCIILAFISPVMALLQTIPSCVMGGVCLTLYGFIAVSGLKMFKHLDLGDNKNLFVVSAILISGIGGLTIQIPYAIAENGLVTNNITITSIATALIIGILTNVILTKIESSKLGVEPVEATEEATEEVTEAEEI